MIGRAVFHPFPDGKRGQSCAQAARSILTLMSILVLAGAATAGSQQDGNTKASAMRRASVAMAKSRISLDGMLDEPDWGEAPVIGDILQREPKQGEAATERTEVKLLYDSANFYVGVMCYDSEPDRIIGTQMARDGDLGSDDTLEILIDTFSDRRNGFYFATNPAGVLVDGLIIENGQLNREWDAIWNRIEASMESRRNVVVRHVLVGPRE